MVAVREVEWQLRLLLGRMLVYILAETMTIVRSDFSGFASPSTQTPREHLKLRYRDFLPYTLHFILRRVRKIAKAIITFVMCLSVRQSVRNNSAPTQRIFMKFDISVFFRKSVGRLQFHSILIKISGTVIKTYVHLKQYLAELLEWEKFQIKVVQKIKTHILCSKTLYRKSCPLWDNVEIYVTAGQVADDNITRRMRFASWIMRATETHLEYAILLLYHSNNGWTNPPNVKLYVHRLSRFQ